VDLIYRYDFSEAFHTGFTSLIRSHPEQGDHLVSYWRDEARLSSPYGHTLSPLLADLREIATAIAIADRLSRRPIKKRGANSTGAWRGWSRTFSLRIGVCRPEFWSNPAVLARLIDVATWMTEDTWNFSFARFNQREQQQSTLFVAPPSTGQVVLYSGGLDSFAGVATLLHRDPTAQIMLLSAVHNRLLPVLDRQILLLRKAFPNHHIQHAHLPFYRRSIQEIGQQLQGSNVHVREEISQRARGLLFWSNGVAEAWAMGATSVLSCENGIGALNLPMNWRQLGSQHSRATHPRTVMLINRLLETIPDLAIRCSLPFLFTTKAELCRILPTARLVAGCAATVSCDSFPQREKSPVPGTEIHCGTCTSCILRRQSLFAAGLAAEDTVPYRQDVCIPFPVHRQSRLEPLKMMLDQIFTLREALAQDTPFPYLLREFPELLTALQAIESNKSMVQWPIPDPVGAFIALFRRYIDEWHAFPYQVAPA
jgi:hypothetical protein